MSERDEWKRVEMYGVREKRVSERGIRVGVPESRVVARGRRE